MHFLYIYAKNYSAQEDICGEERSYLRSLLSPSSSPSNERKIYSLNYFQKKFDSSVYFVRSRYAFIISIILYFPYLQKERNQERRKITFSNFVLQLSYRPIKIGNIFSQWENLTNVGQFHQRQNDLRTQAAYISVQNS